MALESTEIVRLNSIADRFRRLLAQHSTARESTPVNLAEERERTIEAVGRGQVISPKFQYSEDDIDSGVLISQASELLRLTVGSATEWDDIVHDEVRVHLRTVDAIRSHDADVITGLTLSRFGEPAPAVVALAESIVAVPRETIDGSDELSPSEAAIEFDRVIGESDLAEWTVKVVDNLHARVAVNSRTRTLEVSSSARFSPVSVKRLVVHEIGTHILRAMNGGRQRLRLLGLPLGASEPTEEGLAVLNEARAGLLDPGQVRKYALRALAASWSQSSGFQDIVERLLALTDARSAVEIAIRAKRGIRDLDAPGAHVKDVSYLAGYVELARHLGDYPADYDLLMSVKQPLERLPMLRAALQAGDVELWPGCTNDGALPNARKTWPHPDGDPFGWVAMFAASGAAAPALSGAVAATDERGGVELSAMIISMHRGRSSSVNRAQNRRIVGDISLDEASVSSTLEFVNCSISGTFSARNAALRSIRFVDCEVGHIDLSQSRIDGDIVIENSTIGTGEGSALSAIGVQVTGNFAADARRSKFLGAIDLAFADIDGRIELKDATIEGSERTLTNGDRALLGLVLTRASAVGGLRLRGATVRGQLRGIGFRSGGQLNLTESRIENPAQKAISMQRGVFGTTVLARGMTVAGTVDFGGSVIDGNLVLEGLHVQDPSDGQALNLDDVRCDHLKLRGTAPNEPKHELKNATLFERATPRDEQRRTTLDGTVLIRSAVVKERVELDALLVRSDGIGIDLSGSEIGQLLARVLTVESASAHAIDAESCTIEGRADFKDSDFAGSVILNNSAVGGFVSFRRCEWHGPGDSTRLSMRSAKVGQDADLRGVRFTAGSRVDASGSSVSGTLWWREIERPPKLDLDSAHIHELDDEKESWPAPGDLNLQGSRIDHFARGGWDPDSVDRRLEWISRQRPFAPDAYQKLASYYRNGGSEYAARRVLLKLYKEEIQATPSRSRRFWQRIWYSLTGYGYRLGGVGWLATVVIVLSVLTAFWAQASLALVPTDSASVAVAGVCTSAYPCFDPLIFGVDAAVPILDLHHADFWVPDRSTPSGVTYDILLAMWALLGWVTITIAAGGIAQRITR